MRRGRIEPSASGVALAILLLIVSMAGCRRTATEASPEPQAEVAPGALPPDGNPPARTPDLLEPLVAVWNVRDQLAAIRPEDGWSPAEYAPHLWRQLNARLVEFGARARGGIAFNQSELGDLLRQYDAGLRALQAPASGVPRAEPWQTLVQARDRIAARESALEAGHFASPSNELSAVGLLIRRQQRILYETPDFVQWYAQASILGSPSVSFVQALKELIGGLRAFNSQVGDLADRPLTESAASSLRSQFDQVDAALGAVRTAFDAALQSTIENLSQPQARIQAEAFLASPLLSAEQRRQLITALYAAAEPTAPLSQTKTLPAFPVHDFPSPKLEAISQTLELERALLELVDDDPPATLIRQLASSQSLAVGDSDERILDQLRRVGDELQTYYRELPARVAAQASSERGQARRLAFLVRPADASRMTAQQVDAILPRLAIRPPQIAPRLAVKIQTASVPIELSETDTTRIPIAIESNNPSLNRASLKLDFDGRLVQLRQVGSDQEILPGTALADLPVSAEDSTADRQSITLEALALRQRAGSTQPVSITLLATAGSIRATQEIVCRLPGSRRIDLRVLPASAVETNFKNRDVVRLRPFPSRTTRFTLQLVNAADEARQVDLALVRLDRPPRASFPRGRLVMPDGNRFADLNYKPRDAKRDILAIVSDLALPGGGKAIPIPFQIPAADAAGAAPSATGLLDKLETSSLAPSDVTDGMALVIQDKQTSDIDVKWIEIRTRVPSEYLQATSQYEPDQGRLSITIEPLDRRVEGELILPSSGPGEAPPVIGVDWDFKAVDLTKNVRGKFGASLDLAGISPAATSSDLLPKAELWADVPSRADELTVEIPLTVDGYPRAFVHQLSVHRKSTGKDLRIDQHRVRILSITHQKQTFLTNRDLLFDLPKDAPPLRYLDEGLAAAFRPNDEAPILVGFQVDAPRDTFAVSDGKTAAVQVSLASLGTRGQAFSLFDDRDVSVGFGGASADGELKLSTKVSDFNAFEVPIARQRGALQLAVRTRDVQGFDFASDSRMLILDDDPPDISVFQLAKREVFAGEPILVEWEAVDRDSGLKSVRLGLTAEADAILPEDAKTFDISGRDPPALQLPSKDPGNYWVQAEFTDQVGNRVRSGGRDRDFMPERVNVKPPKPATKGDATAETPPLKGSLQGYVIFGSLESGAACQESRCVSKATTSISRREPGPGDDSGLTTSRRASTS